MRTHVNFNRENKIEAMYGKSPVNVKVEPRSTFTFTRGLLFTVSISFTHVKCTCVRAEKFENCSSKKYQSLSLFGYLMVALLTGKENSRLKKKFLNTRTSS